MFAIGQPGSPARLGHANRLRTEQAPHVSASTSTTASTDYVEPWIYTALRPRFTGTSFRHPPEILQIRSYERMNFVILCA